jgi:tetratricopeptide (TPR) repeat protein
MPPQPSAAVSRRRSLDTITSWVLFATVVVSLFAFMPTDNSLPLSMLKSFVLAGGALITLALYILARLGRGNVIFPPLALLGALWLPVVAYALSALFSGVSFMGALWGVGLESDTLGFMLTVAALGTLTALVLRRSEHYRAFLTVGAYSFAAFVALQVLIVLVGQVAPNTISPAFSLVGSFNDLASVAGLGIVAILITLRFMELSRRTYRAVVAMGVLGLFLLAIANSSLVWIIVALTSLGLFVESVMRRGSRSPDSDLDAVTVMDEAPVESDAGSHSLVLPLVVLAVSLFFLIGGTLGGALANALHVNVLNVRPSWQSTFAVAHQAYTTAPVFGTGPNTFGVQWLKYRDASLNSTVFWNIDFSSGIGFVPTSLVTTGVVGAIAWIALILLFVVLGLRMLLRSAPQDPFTRHTAILSFVGTLYLFAVMIFDLPNAFVIALTFMFAGLFISTMRFGARGQQWGILFARSPRMGFVIVFALTILLLSSVVAAYSLVEHALAASQLAKASTELSAGNLDAADAAAQSSLSFAPSSAAYQVQAGVANGRLNAIAASSTMEKTAAQQAYQTALSAGINAALTATNIDPSNYQNWLALGNLYAQAVPLNVSGAYDSAKTAYEKAAALNPTNPQIPYILAQLDIAHNDTKAAEADLKNAITLKQDYTAAIFLLSQLEVRDGNVKDALQAALAAAYFTPNNPNILFQVGILYAAQNDFANAQAALAAAVAANPQFANARYFLSAVYAKQGDLKNALAEMQAIADLSSDNATAVATQLASLKAGKNPFPANLLSINSAPVQ